MEVELEMGQEQVDFDFHNNHLCSNHSFHCSNRSFHHIGNPDTTMML